MFCEFLPDLFLAAFWFFVEFRGVYHRGHRDTENILDWITLRLAQGLRQDEQEGLQLPANNYFVHSAPEFIVENLIKEPL